MFSGNATGAAAATGGPWQALVAAYCVTKSMSCSTLPSNGGSMSA